MHHAKAYCCNTNTNPQYADNNLHIGDFAYPYFLWLAGSRNGEVRPPEAALTHELGHAENDKNGTSIKYNQRIANGKEGTLKEQTIEQEKRDRNEVTSIYYENIVREKEGYPQRGYNYSAGD